MTEIDCIAESLQPEVFAVDDRVFTVSYATRYGDYTRIPAIMKGLCLNEAGFSTGTKVDVKVMKSCMILMSRESEPEIETLMDAVLARNADKAGELIYQYLLSPISIIKGRWGSSGGNKSFLALLNFNFNPSYIMVLLICSFTNQL